MYIDKLAMWLELLLREDFLGHLLFQQDGITSHLYLDVRASSGLLDAWTLDSMMGTTFLYIIATRPVANSLFLLGFFVENVYRELVSSLAELW
jgi:hypothetical protein